MVCKKLDFVPFADFVLIDEIPNNMTPGGIALPDNASNGPKRGTVVRVGPGRWENGVFIESEVEIGDIVYMAFAYNEPIVMELDGNKYVLARTRDLIGKTENACGAN